MQGKKVQYVYNDQELDRLLKRWIPVMSVFSALGTGWNEQDQSGKPPWTQNRTMLQVSLDDAVRMRFHHFDGWKVEPRRNLFKPMPEKWGIWMCRWWLVSWFSRWPITGQVGSRDTQPVPARSGDRLTDRFYNFAGSRNHPADSGDVGESLVGVLHIIGIYHNDKGVSHKLYTSLGHPR